MPTPGFNVKKAAQVAAYFAKRGGGTINVLKLTKLIYLADREFLSRYDMPILWDRLVSMPHGPVNSDTYAWMDGQFGENQDWDAYLSDRNNHDVALANPEVAENDLDELSEAELEILDHTWRAFGHMDRFQLRDYTHKHCPEWENPEGSSSGIPYDRVLKYLNKDHAVDTADDIESLRNLDRVFARLR